MANPTFLRTVTDRPAERHPRDFYPTPPRGTRALMEVEKFKEWIWEPACGDGRMSEVLSTKYHVMSSDLHNYGYGETGVDFFACKKRVPNIVTNPPFKIAAEFARHALSLAQRKVALLARLSWLEGQKRRDLFTTTPLARVWVFSKRLGIPKDGEAHAADSGMVAFAWYVWEHGHVGPPNLGWLE